MAPRYRKDLAVIGFDADGVINCYGCGLQRTLRALGHPAAEHPAINDHDPHDWNQALNAGITYEDLTEIQHIGTDMGTIYDGIPYPGARDAMARVYYGGHRVVIITARDTGSIPGRARADTARWLARHEFPYDDLIVSEDKTVGGADAFLDDRTKNVAAVNAAGAVGFLQVRNHNRLADHTGLRPVANVGWYADLVLGHTPASLREHYGVPA